MCPALRRSYQPRLGKPKKGVNRNFSWPLGQVIRCSKALDLGSLNMQFKQDGPKDKKFQLFKFLEENFENFAQLSFKMRL